MLFHIYPYNGITISVLLILMDVQTVSNATLADDTLVF